MEDARQRVPASIAVVLRFLTVLSDRDSLLRVKLVPVHRADLIRRLRTLGWAGPYSGTKHQHMVKGSVQLTIPNPHGKKEIGVNLLKLLLNEAGISRDEWLNAR